MAVNHMVWLKFNEGVAQSRKDDHIDALRSLRGPIPGIVDLTLGENFTDRANGYSHALVVTLVDRAALGVYAAHPHHVEVASALRQDAQLLVMDYEF